MQEGWAENGGQLARPTAEEAGSVKAEHWDVRRRALGLGRVWVNYFPKAFLLRFLASKNEEEKQNKG